MTAIQSRRDLGTLRELGGYTLTHRLGVGGMGEVWKGTREALGGSAVAVAIKVLSAAKVDDPEARQMFLDEARLTMLLNSSNIVKLFDAAETEDKTCYMVMEWVDGLNLAELSAAVGKAGETLPDVIIAYIIGEVLKGLAHAHDLRHGSRQLTIVHRDVSPHNVMISVSGEVKVMDFGVARMASEDTSGAHVKGKLRYMPPEQLRGRSREPTLDLFAVGAMLHELLDRAKFRGGVDEGRLYGMILDGEVPAMTRPLDTLPSELDEIRGQLLAAKPEDRIQTAREAFGRLSRWPGYRDARFELDEIVRRFVAKDEPKTALLPTQPSQPQPPREAPGVPVVLPPVAQVGSFTGHAVDGAPADTPTDPTMTARLPAGNPEPDARDQRRITAIVLALCAAGLAGLLGLAAATMSMFETPDAELPKADPAVITEIKPERASEASQPEDEVEVEVNVDGPRLDLGQAPAPATVDETPPEPASSDTDDGEDEVEEDTATDPPTKPPPVKTTKVALTLGGGVPWAEIKLGGRSFVLDAFGSKSAATRLAPGRHSASFRTKVGGPWQQAGRVEIPAGRATVTLQKSGELVVK